MPWCHIQCSTIKMWSVFSKFVTNIHTIARPWGWAMGCLLWVEVLIYVMPQSLQSGIILCVPSQWEMTLHCNVISHWLGTHTQWSLLQWCIHQCITLDLHDDVIKWKHFLCNWPFVQGIHRSPDNSPHKGQWRGALMFSLICVWINDWVNNREAGDLRCCRAHYDVIVMVITAPHCIIMWYHVISDTQLTPCYMWDTTTSVYISMKITYIHI